MAETTTGGTNMVENQAVTANPVVTLNDSAILEIDRYDPIAIRPAVRLPQILSKRQERGQEVLDIVLDQFDIFVRDIASVQTVVVRFSRRTASCTSLYQQPSWVQYNESGNNGDHVRTAPECQAVRSN
jgi:hypothetical protein